MMTIIVRSCDRLAFATTASHDMYEHYVGRRALESRSRVFEAIPTACDCLSAGDDRNPDQLLFVGGFLEHKGIRESMAAWDELAPRRPDARFVIIGKGRLQDEVLAWAAHRPSVTVVVDPPRSVIHHALRTSGAVILLSQRAGHWREQIGLPIQEGLGHGCEIVTTTETGLAGWLSRHGHAVLAPEAGASEVAAAIEAALGRARGRTGSLEDLPGEDQRFVADWWMMAAR
jgi:glycosyltransferase involved in cell wall biosynthesis